jgi:hypothetical protein
VECDANMPNVDASNEMERVSQMMHHVSNDGKPPFLCFGYPRIFVRYTNVVSNMDHVLEDVVCFQLEIQT